VEGLHQRVAVLQHGALVDGALVGDFALVDGGRLVQQVQPGDAGGAAGGLRASVSSTCWKWACTAGLSSTCCSARAVGQAGELANGGGGKEQRAHFVAVDAGDHRVLHVGRGGGDDPGPQRPHADEGAGGQLEVLGDAAVEAQAAGAGWRRRSSSTASPVRRSPSSSKHFGGRLRLRQ
jgi:hypothetical protein